MFKTGDRVFLPGCVEDGFPEEHGEFIGYSSDDMSMCLVLVDVRTRGPSGDDGIREVSVNTVFKEEA